MNSTWKIIGRGTKNGILAGLAGTGGHGKEGSF